MAFDLPLRAAYGREDYFVSPGNALVLAVLEGWQAWPSGKMLLVGPGGAGKTHLAHVWAAATGAIILRGADLALTDLGALPARAVVVDDAPAVAGTPGAEAALFHLHNLQAAARQPLLLTAATAPRDWGLALPDLASRMQATPLTRLEAPDDALLTAVLVKLFNDRQLTVSPQLVGYLVSRMDRSFEAARSLVAALDARALAQGRPITRALAAEMLDNS